MEKIKKLNEIFKEIYELQASSSRLEWVLYTTGYDFGVEKEYEKITNALKNKDSYAHILKCMEADISTEDKRRAEIVKNLFKPYHLSDELNKLDIEIQKKVNELSKILNTFRYTLEGREISSVEINQILSNDSNRERRKQAYFARNQINKPMVDGGFIDLINLRKEYARLQGSENFVAYMLEANELDKDTFDNWLPQLHDILPKMNQVRERYAKEFLEDDRIMPWDELYIDSRLAPSLNSSVDMSSYYSNIKELFDMFGIDISRFNITYDIFPRTNKSQWAYNFPIETAKDSRILANVKSKYFEYGTLLHETGHAIHSFLLDPAETILNQGVSGIISEGIANLFQSFLYEPIFYNKFFKDSDTAGREFKLLKEYRNLTSLRALNRIFFDHSLYKNNIQSLEDIYALYWKNQREVLQEEPFGTEPPWGFVIHYTTHPIYFHNYFMGDVSCKMLSKVFESRFGAKMTEKPLEFGSFLIDEVIKPAGMYRYNDLFKRISGEDFSLRFMLD